MPPTQYLIMETLMARWRLGERTWTFPSTCRKAIIALGEAGLVGYKHGIVAQTTLVWFTDHGLRTWTDGHTYTSPLERAIEETCGTC